jgi:hypothetical protein
MTRIADCGLRIAERTIRDPQFEIRSLAASLHVGLHAVIFCFGLIPAVPAQTPEKKCGLRIADCGTEADKPTQRVESQTPDSGGQLSILKPSLLDAERQTSTDQRQPIEPKLPAVRCTIAPSKDAVRWQATPETPGTEKDNDCGLRIADCGTDNPKLSSQASSDPIVLAQMPNQQQPVEPKLPSVRCTIAPSKDAVRWQSTPTTPVVEKDYDCGMRNADCGTGNPKLSSQASKDKSQTPNADNDCGMPNLNCETSNPQSAIRNPHFNSDGWFQISTETPEPTDIQETVLTTSEGNKAGPQPLAQVLANLARYAERNFVDPGIPADETITYNFADSDLDPWEAFTRIAEARGYRIVYWGDVVTLTRNQQDPLSPVNPHTVKAEVWVWVDQSAKPRDDRRGLVLQLAGADVTPNSKPQTVRSLEAGSKATISFIDAQSERGDSTLRLTVNPVLLPNGNIEAGLGIENAVPALDGHKGVTIRRNINHTLELTPTKQVVDIDGILMPSNDPAAGKQSWIQRLFRSKKAPEKSTARMVVKLTVEPVAGSQTPMPTDNPIRIPGSDSGKTGVVLAPGQVRRTPELTSIQTLKR